MPDAILMYLCQGKELAGYAYTTSPYVHETTGTNGSQKEGGAGGARLQSSLELPDQSSRALWSGNVIGEFRVMSYHSYPLLPGVQLEHLNANVIPLYKHVDSTPAFYK